MTAPSPSFAGCLSRVFIALVLLLVSVARGVEPGPDKETSERRAHFRQLYNEGNALYHGKHDAVAGLALYEQLEREVRLADDSKWLVTAVWKVAQVHGDAGRLERAVELYEEARELIFNEPGTVPGTANHFLVLGNLCGNYERLGRMGMHALRHHEAVEQARALFARRTGTPPDADPFGHDDETMLQLNNIGFIGQVFFREAQARFDSGRADEAIALALRLDWRLGAKPYRNHWEKKLHARTWLRLAQWNHELGRDAERDRWETRLLVPEGESGHGSLEWHLCRLRRAARLHALGDERPKWRAAAEDSLAAIHATNHTGLWLENHAPLARMLADEGQGIAALAMLDRAITTGANLQEPLARTRLLLARAELRCDLGQGASADTWADLLAALTWARSVGGLREEPRAFLLYARHLRLAGREAEARDVLAYAEARFARFIEHALKLAYAKEGMALERGPSTPPPRTNKPVAAIDAASELQPIEIVTRLHPGESVGARFTVTNPNPDAVEGVLHVTGQVSHTHWDGDALIWRVSLDDSATSREMRQDLRLDPLEQARIVLRRTGATPATSATEVGWTVPGHKQVAWWRFAPATSQHAARLRNDNLALANPFYSVPLHHPLDDAARAVGGTINLRVRARPPARVEIVDDGTGATLAVDARGDGDFRGAGDVLWRDDDGDGYPELRLTNTKEGGVELYVYPSRTDADTEIILEARLPDGLWVPQSTDTILRMN